MTTDGYSARLVVEYLLYQVQKYIYLFFFFTFSKTAIISPKSTVLL